MKDWDGKGVGTSEMSEEKLNYFNLELKEIDPLKWNFRIENDQKRFLEKLNIQFDKRGIKGDSLFPLTLDKTNQRELKNIRSLKILSGELTNKEIFVALCPELENFVTLINWIGGQDSLNQDRIDLKKILDQILDENNKNKTCSIFGNYRLSSENYAVILPFRGEYSLDDKIIQGWENSPYLKRTSETFLGYPSPMFSSIVNSLSLGGDSLKEKKLFCFSAIFKLNYSNLEEGCIDVLSATSSRFGRINVKLNLTQQKLDLISKNRDNLFLGLFANVIDSDKKWEISLIDLSNSCLNSEEIINNLISTRLYYNYLTSNSLYVCTITDLKKRLDKISFQVSKNINVQKEDINFDIFYNKYLKNFFYLSQNNVYYIPCFLKEGNLKEIIGHFENIVLLEKEGKTYLDLSLKLGIENMKKFEKEVRQIKFVKWYNTFSKRGIIDMVQNSFVKNKESVHYGEWKWRI